MSTTVIDRAYTFTATGLRLSRALSHDEWRELGRKIAALLSSTPWILGDWLVYGFARQRWGDTYTQAEMITHRSLESLSQYARVAEAFPPGVRLVDVPWSLHREALRVPDAQARLVVLQKARAFKWHRQQLAGHINVLKLHASVSLNPDAGTAQERSRWGRLPAAQKHRVRCPNCACSFYVRRKAYGLAPFGLELPAGAAKRQ